ncbi:DUF397 domain-containing protein [Actinomadura chibensis]|uniref:DUF397 domain-containing protein n=2 Tax=Actinomadura chibensis TaxID=392828 RepID=A0A5D0P113_9ACTN|nr:DUF397 domain-containing protein [Actinomadura chibensis]
MTSRPTWRKSSYSGGDGGHCVELALISEDIGVRDSKDPDGPELHITRDTFRALITNLKRLP